MIGLLSSKISGLARRHGAEKRRVRTRRVAPRLDGLEHRELLTHISLNIIIVRHLGAGPSENGSVPPIRNFGGTVNPGGPVILPIR